MAITNTVGEYMRRRSGDARRDVFVVCLVRPTARFAPSTVLSLSGGGDRVFFEFRMVSDRSGLLFRKNDFVVACARMI